METRILNRIETVNENPQPEIVRNLEKRMRGPQRHRLLQGYPMPALMKSYAGGAHFEPVKPDLSRKLIVGILPHATCAPSVKACGYCTFPHEQFQKTAVERTVESVIQESGQSGHKGRKVEALYFGGGTANLTPPLSFAKLTQTALEHFDLSQAEVTLEGAPAFFLSHRFALLDILQQMPTESQRLSMGVQTFDLDFLDKMGRLSLGNPEQVQNAVKQAHKRGMTCSADLMINLPGQSLEQMLSDVERASDMGFDQVCVYHLVLFRGLGTPWSKNRDMLSQLPNNEQAYENWLRVVDRVKELGFQQKTVTNFQRRGNYRYENDSFQPEQFDALGYGPAGISGFTDLSTQTAVKWINANSNESFRRAMSGNGNAKERLFVYGQKDLKLLYLTRSLAGMSADREIYRNSYGGRDMLDDFSAEFEACEHEGLVNITPQKISLTSRGNFFADSVTGLLAAGRVSEIRNTLDDPNSSKRVHMG